MFQLVLFILSTWKLIVKDAWTYDQSRISFEKKEKRIRDEFVMWNKSIVKINETNLGGVWFFTRYKKVIYFFAFFM